MFVMLQLLERGVRCQELENVFSIFALQLFYIRVQSSLIGKSPYYHAIYNIKFEFENHNIQCSWLTETKVKCENKKYN